MTPWRAGAEAAYTIVHDDFCDYTTYGLQDYAVAELSQRGLRAGFGAITSLCVERNFWSVFEETIAAGHEIVNHSMTHGHLTEPDSDLETEIHLAGQLIEDNVPGARVEYFVFPFDEFDDRTLGYLREHGYVGARAGTRGVSPADLEDPFRARFDTYGPDYSIYKPEVDAGTVTDVLGHYVEAALAEGGWALRELHGVEDASWEPVPLADYRAHLDQVAEHVRAGRLWMDGPSTITRYIRSRRHCGKPELVGSKLSFATPDGECARSGGRLTVELRSKEPLGGLSARQGGAALETRPFDAHTALILDVDPTREVEIDPSGSYDVAGSN